MKKLILILSLFLLVSISKATDYYIFGYDNNTENYTTFLGCLSCGKTGKNSVWNPYGQYGNKYNSDCIWNTYSKYANDYGPYSWNNSQARKPPIVIDENANFICLLDYKIIVATDPN